jgi:potassium channel LctB
MMIINRQKRMKMLNHFTVLFILYMNVVIAFALIYNLLDILDIGFIVDHYATVNHQEHWMDRIITSFYFSVITMFSVGYGDVTPFGLSRAVAIIEAMLGYILPAVIVIQYMKTSDD